MEEPGFEGWMEFRSQAGEEHGCTGGRTCRGAGWETGNPSSLFRLEACVGRGCEDDESLRHRKGH